MGNCVTTEIKFDASQQEIDDLRSEVDSLRQKIYFYEAYIKYQNGRISSFSDRQSQLYTKCPAIDFELIEDDARHVRAIKGTLVNKRRTSTLVDNTDYRFTRQRSMRLSREMRGLESWQKMCSGHDVEKVEPLATQPCWIISPIVEGKFYLSVKR